MGFIEKHVYVEVFAVASLHHIYYIYINLFFQEKSLTDTRKLRELSVEKYFTRKVLRYPRPCKYVHILYLQLIQIR